MKNNFISGKFKMGDEYDFSKSIKNPYTKKLKKQVTIKLEHETFEYFKKLAIETDIPYQKLINLFLKNCAEKQMKQSILWEREKIAT